MNSARKHIKNSRYCLWFLLLVHTVAFSQEFQSKSSSEIFLNIKKLKNTASVLYIGTRPNNINTQLLTFLSNERLVRCGYLSITRGESTKNHIADETGIDLGLIHTQEMIKAANAAGIQPFFTRAYDIGTTKSAAAAFKIWTKAKLLSDVVDVIRQFQPDVIIIRYDSIATGGENSATAQLVREAFTVAADSSKFNENAYTPWQAKRLLWNVSDDTTTGPFFSLPVHKYNSLLGSSYYEQAVNSRSFQKTEGLEYIYSKEKPVEQFKLVAGDSFSKDIFEGVDTGWTKFKNAEEVSRNIDSILAEYNFIQPELSISKLGTLYHLIQYLPGSLHSKGYALAAIQNLMFNCSGITVSAIASQEFAVQGDTCQVRFTVENGKQNDLVLTGIRLNAFDTSLNSKETSFTKDLVTSIIEDVSQPFWLASAMDEDYVYRVNDALQIGRAENTPIYIALFSFDLNGSKLIFRAPVTYQYKDKLKGTRSEILSVISPVTVSMKPNILLTNVSTVTGKKVMGDSLEKIQFKTNFTADNVPTSVKVAQPSYKIIMSDSTVGSKIRSDLYTVDTTMNMQAGDVYSFGVPLSYLQLEKNKINSGVIGASVAITTGGVTRGYSSNLRSIDYGYIPPVTYNYRDLTAIIGDKIKTVATTNVGYVNRYYDNVCDGLNKLGYTVKLLSYKDFAVDSIAKWKVIFVKGDIDLADSVTYKTVYNYVNNGGNLVVQLSQNDAVPTPFINAKLSSARINAYNSTVQQGLENNPLFKYPNPVNAGDFIVWRKDVSTSQLAIEDDRFTPLLSFRLNDDNTSVPVLTALTLGKGKIIYSGLTFGYQKSSGVASAYKLMANLLGYLM